MYLLFEVYGKVGIYLSIITWIKALLIYWVISLEPQSHPATNGVRSGIAAMPIQKYLFRDPAISIQRYLSRNPASFWKKYTYTEIPIQWYVSKDTKSKISRPTSDLNWTDSGSYRNNYLYQLSLKLSSKRKYRNWIQFDSADQISTVLLHSSTMSWLKPRNVIQQFLKQVLLFLKTKLSVNYKKKKWWLSFEK